MTRQGAGCRAGTGASPTLESMSTQARDHCLAPERVDASLDGGSRYGRMFDLPALVADDELLHRIGAAGGFCDGADSDDESTVEAGWPFFGQYIAHDLTADRSPLRAHADLEALRNVRTPRANLEVLYGGGPVGSPYLFSRADGAKLATAPDGRRAPQPRGRRADRRPSQRLAQCSSARCRWRSSPRTTGWSTACAKTASPSRRCSTRPHPRAATWHYQWLIVNQLVRGLAGDELVDEPAALRSAGSTSPKGRRSSRWSSPTPPIDTATPQIRQRTGSTPGGRAAAADVPRPDRLRADSATGAWTGRAVRRARPSGRRSGPRRSTAGFRTR